ncbi:MAG TPA: serine/threonine-protein kinase [Polyangiaceae bacterium]|nr:serine/threonine-protein kinase [Polyangiaceae bacterium]
MSDVTDEPDETDDDDDDDSDTSVGGQPAVKDTKSKKQAVLEKARRLVGTVISDRYQVEEVLAAGGMGCVYRGQHMHMRKRVAIKVLLPDTEGLPDLVMRFEREAIAGAHIDHPNVAAATDFGKLPDGSFFLVQEYIRGITLHDLIKQGPIPPARAVRIARQIALALDACHQMGVVHRDVKPRNVMLEEGRNDFVKLIDFGLAKVPVDRISTIGENEMAKSRRPVTALGVVFGTIAYISPEASFGMGSVSEKSDLYALGVMLYEMLAGAHPFDTKSSGELFRRHRAEIPPPIRVRAPGVDAPPRLEAVAMRLLEKDPAARFESARAVIAAIDAAMPSAALELVSASAGPATPLRLAGSISSQPPLPVSVPPEAPPPEPAAPKSPEPPPSASGEAGEEGTEEPEGYVPRLGRPPSPSMTGGGTPRWVIAGTLALGLAAALGTALFLWRSMEGGDRAVRAADEGALDSTAAKAREALDAASKAPPSAIEGLDAAAFRSRIRTSAEGKEWGRGADALLALAELDPKAFEARDIAGAAVAVAAGIELGSDPRSDKIFDVLVSKLGTTGLDILYSIVSTRGGSKAAIRATELLRTKEVIERASPALRIAVELRDAPCSDKLALLPRARNEGDVRAITVLDILRSDKCNPRVGQCCFRKNNQVEDAIRHIRARLRGSGE